MCEPIHYLPIRVGGRKEKGAIFVLLHRKRQSEAPICHHVLHIFFSFFFSYSLKTEARFIRVHRPLINAWRYNAKPRYKSRPLTFFITNQKQTAFVEGSYSRLRRNQDTFSLDELARVIQRNWAITR